MHHVSTHDLPITRTGWVGPRRCSFARASKNDPEEGPVPCPWCGYSIVTRVGAQGPYFYCLCRDRLSRARSAAE